MNIRRSLSRLGLAAIASLGLAGAAQAYDAAASTTLNMRSGPGTQYGVVDTIPAGGLVSVGQCSGSWCRVNYDGLGGWASANYLQGVRYSQPRPTYREPVYVERPVVVERPVIVERPIVVREPRYVRRDPYYYGHRRPYRDRGYYDRGYYDEGGSFSVGVTFGNRY